MPSKTTFGQRLRLHREAKGWTQYRLAKEAQIHRSYVAQIEDGEKVPGWEIVTRLADVLGVEVGEFR